jgi:hypothetical protein
LSDSDSDSVGEGEPWELTWFGSETASGSFPALDPAACAPQ